MTTFALGEAEASSCPECGYAGVEADHSGEPRLAESWEEAFARFQEQHD